MTEKSEVIGEVTEAFSSQCSQLMRSRSLPYNPYPGFVKAFRVKEQEAALEEVDVAEEQTRFRGQLQELEENGLYRTNTEPAVFGNSKVLQFVHSPSLEPALNLAASLRPPSEFIVSGDHDHEFDFCLALTGHHVFIGVICNMSPLYEFRAHYLAYSGAIDKQLLEKMTKNVMMHLSFIEQIHTVIGMRLAPDKKLWTVDMIKRNASGFLDAVNKGLQEKQQIHCDLLLTDPKNKSVSHPVSIQYCLTVILNADSDIDQKRTIEYATLPMLSLHDAVFFSEDDLNLYFSAYVMSELTTDGNPIMDYMSKEITKPIYEDWKLVIAESQLDTQFYEIIQAIILSLVSDDSLSDSEDEALLEIVIVLKSRSAKLNFLMQRNRLVRNLLDIKVPKRKDTISKLLEAYKSDLSEYLTATLRKVNDAKSHQNALKYRISSLLDDVKPVHDEAGVIKVRGTLRTINHVLIAYALTQTEDIISMMPALRKLYKNLVSGHPGVQPLTSLALTSRRSYAHGLEQEQKMRARQNVIALDCDDRELLESAFMSYVVENHLDEVWRQILLDMNQQLTDNAWLIAREKFQRSAYCMELCHTPALLLRRSLGRGIYTKQICKPAMYLYRLHQISAFGLRTALSYVMDPILAHNLELILQICQGDSCRIENDLWSMIALSGSSTVFGNMNGYLDKLEVSNYWSLYGVESSVASKVLAKCLATYLHELDKKEDTFIYELNIGETATKWYDFTSNASDLEKSLVNALSSKEMVQVTIYTLDDWRYLAIEMRIMPRFIQKSDKSKQMLFYSPDPVDLYRCVFGELEQAERFLNENLQPNGTEFKDPYNSNVLSPVLVELDQRAGAIYDKYNYFDATKTVICKAITAQGTACLTEGYFLLNSTAAELAYLCSLCKDLGAVIEHQIMTNTAELPTCIQKLNGMFDGFYKLMSQIIDCEKTTTVMTARHLPRVLHSKLATMLEKTTNGYKLLVTTESLLTLKDIHDIISGVEWTSTQAVFDELCPKTLRSIMASQMPSTSHKAPKAVSFAKSKLLSKLKK